MKFKFLLFFALCFAFSTKTLAQMPAGKAKLLEFTNESGSFTVPEGKAWVIYSVFSDYILDGVIKYDEFRKRNAYENGQEVRIFIKELNGEEKTNLTKHLYGPQLYRSTNNATSLFFPLVFPPNTSFSLILFKGDPGALQLYNKKGYISLMEVDN